MKVPSHKVPANSFGPRTVPVDQLFKPDPEAADTFQGSVSDIYFKAPKEQTSLATVLHENKTRYEQLVAEAVAQGKMSAADGQAKKQLFQNGKLGPHGSPSNQPLLRELENNQFLLLHHPQQCADGLYRTQDYYVSPGALHLGATSKGWDISDDIPVADAVVVGAGPGGLTTAWQFARRGGRVVCFESELAGAAFSDAGAKPVHSLRTSADGTNLVQDGHALATLEHPLSLHGNLASHRLLATQGLNAEAELTGLPSHGVAQESQQIDDRNSPATRGELFEHLAKLSHSLATDFDNAFLCERSPVNEVSFDEESGFFTVTTARGHRVKAKELVLATGLTGPQGQRARLLPQLTQLEAQHPKKVLSLSRTEDLASQAKALSDLHNGVEKQALVVQDRLLGHQPVRQAVSDLAPGSRVAVIGSGESAIKSALELAHLNPEISVDLFAKNTIEVAQTQLPNENFHTAVLEQTLRDPEAIEKAKARTKLFGTPVTPRSLLELFELQKAGRVRLLEMGHYFDQHTVELNPTKEGTIEVELKSPAVAEILKKGREKFAASGLLPQDDLASFRKGSYPILVQAVGYKPQLLNDHPLRHLPPEAHKKMHLNTAGSPNHPAETSLAGLAVGARHLAEKLAQNLPPDRQTDLTVPQERGVDWRDLDPETVQGIIENRGLHPGFAESVRREVEEFGSHPQELRLALPSTDTLLRDLYRKKQSNTIRPEEQEVLSRGLSLSKRMDSH